MIFRYPSCLGVILCDIDTVGFVLVDACRVCDALVASFCSCSLGIHETKWTSYVKRESDVALVLVIIGECL